MASTGASEATDGPVLNLMNKRFRALRKKYNRIIQTEDSKSQGKPINKEQEDVLRSKPVVVALIEEYEKLKQPLTSALQEELQQKSMPNLNANNTPHDGVEDLLKLLYFGTLFDVKAGNELKSIMLTRVHERSSCLTYDYVTEDDNELLGERDLDLLSLLGSLVIARPGNSTLSHKNALNTCLQHAKLWMENSEQPICPEVNISYAELRKRLNKILSLEYFTTTPEMITLSQQPIVEVDAATGKDCISQIQASDSTLQGPVIQIENMLTHYQQKVEDTDKFQAIEQSIASTNHADQSGPIEEQHLPKVEDTDKFQAIEQSIASTNHADQSGPIEEQHLPKDDEGMESGDQGDAAAAAVSPLPQDQQKLQQQPSDGEDQQQLQDYNQGEEVEYKEQQHQYVRQRMTGYQNQRGGNHGGGGQMGGGGYMNGRDGSRGGNRGGGGYQNGRTQYYDQGNYYPPRNFYNQRGRGGGRGGGAPVYNNGRATTAVESDHS